MERISESSALSWVAVLGIIVSRTDLRSSCPLKAVSTENYMADNDPQPLPLDMRLVCPSCHATLTRGDNGLACLGCSREFEFENGFADLVMGERFADEPNEQLALYEEACNLDTTQNYWLPTLRRLVEHAATPARVLSLGCGTGVDVDLLVEGGFSAVGIDCGNRSRMWPRRRQRERLVMANGKHLPFADGTFDAVYCGCVFPHVGVVGDSYRVAEDYGSQRLQLAREMTRVVRPGGRIVVSSPNRLFPCDLFHGRETGSYRLRPYWPSDPFLLSVGDYRRLFQSAGCQRAWPLPVAGYWGFIRARHHWKGRLLRLPVEFLFRSVSWPWLAPLRGSPLNPWIVVCVER